MEATQYQPTRFLSYSDTPPVSGTKLSATSMAR